MIKTSIINFCIWIISKLNGSVIINFKVNGSIQGRTQDVFYIQNDFTNGKALDLNGDAIEILRMKSFSYKIEKR